MDMLKKEIDDYRAALEALTASYKREKSERSHYESECKGAREAQAALQEELRIRADSVDVYKQQVADMSAELGRCWRERTRLEGVVRDVEGELRSLRPLKDSHDILVAEVEQLREKTIVATAEAAHAVSEMERMNSERGAVASQIESSMSKLLEFKEAKVMAESARDEALMEREQLRSKVATLEKDVVCLRRQLVDGGAGQKTQPHGNGAHVTAVAPVESEPSVGVAAPDAATSLHGIGRHKRDNTKEALKMQETVIDTLLRENMNLQSEIKKTREDARDVLAAAGALRVLSRRSISGSDREVELETRYLEARRVAKLLAEKLQDRNDALAALRDCNRMLGERVRELEAAAPSASNHSMFSVSTMTERRYTSAEVATNTERSDPARIEGDKQETRSRTQSTESQKGTQRSSSLSSNGGESADYSAPRRQLTDAVNGNLARSNSNGSSHSDNIARARKAPDASPASVAIATAPTTWRRSSNDSDGEDFSDLNSLVSPELRGHMGDMERRLGTSVNASKSSSLASSSQKTKDRNNSIGSGSLGGERRQSAIVIEPCD